MVYLRLVSCSAMVVFECIVLGSLAAVVVSELYILKKLFTENNFPYVNNSPPAPITNLFGSRSEYAWQIKGEFSWRSDAVQFSSSYNCSQLLIHYAWTKQVQSEEPSACLLPASMSLEFKFSLKSWCNNWTCSTKRQLRCAIPWHTIDTGNNFSTS